MIRKRLAILVSSDKAYYGEEENFNGHLIREIAEKNGFEVVSMAVLPDDQERITREMARIADERRAELILTTGGTGVPLKECTPEATINACDRLLPGVAEGVRTYSMGYSKAVMLNRMAAGIRKKTIMVNLPGTARGIRESMDYMLPQLEIGIMTILGETELEKE